VTLREPQADNCFSVIGAPLMLSFPHFYLGDPRLLEEVEGLKPDPEKHEMYLDVHEVGCAGVERGQLSKGLSVNFGLFSHFNIHVHDRCICSHIIYSSTELYVVNLPKTDVTVYN
jgi:hypothetical protein